MYKQIICAYMLCYFNRVQLFAILWIVAHRAPLSMGFSILEWIAIPPPGNRPLPGIETSSPATAALQVDSLPLSHQTNPNKLYKHFYFIFFIQMVPTLHMERAHFLYNVSGLKALSLCWYTIIYLTSFLPFTVIYVISIFLLFFLNL